jgi:hypothetical protein
MLSNKRHLELMLLGFKYTPSGYTVGGGSYGIRINDKRYLGLMNTTRYFEPNKDFKYIVYYPGKRKNFNLEDEAYQYLLELHDGLFNNVNQP